MLANFLEKSKPINFITYLSFFFVFFLVEIFNTFFSEDFIFINTIKCLVFFICFLVVFFFTNFIITKNRLTLDNTFSFFLFTLFLVFLVDDLLNYSYLSCLLFYFFFLRKTYSLQNNNNVIQKLFDAGFWLGVLVLFSPKSIIFLVLIYAAVLVYNILNFRTLLIPLIGLCIPVFLVFTYFFFVDKKFTFFKELFSIKINITFFKTLKSSWFFYFITCISAVAFLLKTPKTMLISNTFRKNWIIINVNFLIALILIIIGNTANNLITAFLLFPAAVVIANGLELIEKKNLKSAIFGCIVIIIITGNFL